MVKQTRKKLRRQKRKSPKRSTKKMFGGDFSQEESQQLLGMGFTQDDIQVLSGIGVGLNIIQMTLNQVNPATGNNWTTQEMIQSVHEANEEINNLDEGAAVPNQENGVADVPGALYNDVPGAPGANNFEEQGPGLNMEDLGPYSPRSVTEMGGRRRRKSRKQRGGTEFSEEQLTELGRLGFSDNQKKILARGFRITPPNMAMESIRQALQHNYITGQPDTVESIMRMFPNEGGKRRRKSRKQRGGTVFSNEQLTELGNLGFTDSQKKVLAEVMSELDSNTKMNLTRHNLRQIDPRTGQVITIQQYMDDIADSPDVGGGKRRRKSRKQRGGTCYGNGVGANNYDPNFSIYNTRELTLFPYRATN
jgi:hypothetical protein